MQAQPNFTGTTDDSTTAVQLKLCLKGSVNPNYRKNLANCELGTWPEVPFIRFSPPISDLSKLSLSTDKKPIYLKSSFIHIKL